MKNYLYTNWAKNIHYNKKILYPKNLNELKKFVLELQIILVYVGNQDHLVIHVLIKKLISLKKFPKILKLDKKKDYNCFV